LPALLQVCARFSSLAGSIERVGSKRIHHVGVAVADLDEAIDIYSRLFGAELELRETVEEQGVETALMRVGDGRIELLASLEPDTPVGRFIDRRGPGMHHLAFEVDDVSSELERLAATGAELIDERPRKGLQGREIAFVHPHATGGVLAELVACG
jgi:methylmalonyl-CoA/ethylmalonyl-CoA epimerase